MKKPKIKSTLNPEADAKPREPSQIDLTKITLKATELMTLESRIEDAEERLRDLTNLHFVLATQELPNLMESVGMKSFSLSNGASVTVKPFVRAGLPTENAIEKTRDQEAQAKMRERFESGLKYLAKNGAGSLIKNYVEAELGKDSSALAKKVLAALKKLKVEAHTYRGVNAQTLTAWVKERLQGGKDVDFDLFAVFNGHKAEIVMPKEAKVTVKKIGKGGDLF